MSFEIRPDVRQVHLSDIAFFNRNYRDVQSFLYVVNCPVIGMRIKASRAKVMSALTHEEPRQAVLLDDKSLEEAGKFKDVHRKRPGHRRDQKQGSFCPLRIPSSAILSPIAV